MLILRFVFFLNYSPLKKTNKKIIKSFFFDSVTHTHTHKLLMKLASNKRLEKMTENTCIPQISKPILNFKDFVVSPGKVWIIDNLLDGNLELRLVNQTDYLALECRLVLPRCFQN